MDELGHAWIVSIFYCFGFREQRTYKLIDTLQVERVVSLVILFFDREASIVNCNRHYILEKEIFAVFVIKEVVTHYLEEKVAWVSFGSPHGCRHPITVVEGDVTGYDSTQID